MLEKVVFCSCSIAFQFFSLLQHLLPSCAQFYVYQSWRKLVKQILHFAFLNSHLCAPAFQSIFLFASWFFPFCDFLRSSGKANYHCWPFACLAREMAGFKCGWAKAIPNPPGRLFGCFCLFLELWNIHDCQCFDLHFEECHIRARKLNCQYFHFTHLYRSS